MIAALLVWVIASVVGAVVLCCTAKRQKATEPDWLWKPPTDSLSDAAVDARFREIAAHFTVRQ